MSVSGLQSFMHPIHMREYQNRQPSLIGCAPAVALACNEAKGVGNRKQSLSKLEARKGPESPTPSDDTGASQLSANVGGVHQTEKLDELHL